MHYQLPFDILTKVFSFLSPDSLACASSVCKQWHECVSSCISTPRTTSMSQRYNPPWFFALPMQNCGYSYVYNPVSDRWYFPCLGFDSVSISPIASIGSLVLYMSSVSSPFGFGLCNPLTKQNWFLPPPLIGCRTKPAIGVVGVDFNPTNPKFKIFLFGGRCNKPYENTLEMYDSGVQKWQRVGLIPMELAVKLTIYTSSSNQSVYAKGSLYWITNLDYRVMSYDLGAGTWKELNVPMANKLTIGWLVQRNEKLTLVGVTREGRWIWELGVRDIWVLVEKVPSELGKVFFGSRKTWSRIRCVGSDKAIYLYREFGLGMLVWREVCDKGRWEWFKVEGCGSIKGLRIEKFPIKGLLFQPSLHPSFGGHE